MSNILMTPIEAAAPPPEAAREGYRFFDPKAPEAPAEILGVETEAALRLGRMAMGLGVLPYGVSHGLYVLPHAVRLAPLLEQMQSGIPLEPEDVRPYRAPIKGLSTGLYAADKLAAAAIVTGLPLRRALNRKIEREFPVRATEAVAKAREAVASIENEVDYMASFENPREQFVAEVDGLAQSVSAAVTAERDKRVQSGVAAEPEPPRGMLGFFTKVARKVRNFFRFGRRPQVNPEVTAYDAGAGIEKVFRSLSENQAATERRLPLLSKLGLSKLLTSAPLSRDKLALGAPEIIRFLFSLSPNDETGQSLIDEVDHNPHELRFVTMFKKRHKQFSLLAWQNASRNLFPAIRDVLPTEGREIRETYDRLQDLLRYQPPATTTEPSTAPSTEEPKKGLRNRLKSLFRRGKKR